MNFLRSLTFVWTPWSLALAIGGVVVTAGYCFTAWQRSGYRRSVGLLELLRLEDYRPEEKPSVAVLWDASTSMETRDCLAAGQSGSQPITRHQAIAPLTEAAAWKVLDEKLNVVVQSFSDPQAGRGSDLYEPLAEAPEKYANLRGVVLMSDGDWNEGQPPVLIQALRDPT